MLLDPVLLDPALPDPVLPDPVLPDPGVSPAALDEPVPGEALVLPFADDELAGDEPAGVEGLPAGCAVGLVEAELTGEAFGLADALAWAVGLPQMVPDVGLAGFLVPEGLAVAVAVGVALLLMLLVAVGLPLPVRPLEPAAGLVAEVGSELAGLAGTDATVAGLDEPGVDWGDVDWGDADADDCGHDASGVGRCLAVVAFDPAPPAGAWPLRPGGAELVALAPLLTSKVPSKAADTDEVTAWRSGGTEARTTPIANTAQARAMAGLIRPSRQSLGCCVRRARPALCPLWPAFHRLTLSARKPRPAGTALAWADPDRTRARIRSRPPGCGSSWSAAVCSAWRRNSSKSCPGAGFPSWPGRTVTPAPGQHAGPSCRGPYDFSRHRG